MREIQDVLLDLLSRMQKATNGLSDAADDGELSQDSRDRMSAMADGVALAASFVTQRLENKEGRGRVY